MSDRTSPGAESETPAESEEQIDPLEGLMDPEKGENTPASDADASPPG